MTLDEEVAALRAENEALRTQVAILEEELRVAQERLAELEGGKKGPPFGVKASKCRVSGPRPARRKRKAEHNRGRRRETAPKVVVHALEHCPNDECKLYGQSVAQQFPNLTKNPKWCILYKLANNLTSIPVKCYLAHSYRKS